MNTTEVKRNRNEQKDRCKHKFHILLSFFFNDNPNTQSKSINRTVLIIFLITVLFLISIFTFATTYTSSKDGNWNNSATWNPTGILGTGDIVNIVANYPRTIIIPSGYTASCAILNINSTSIDGIANLTFTNATSILNVKSLLP